MSLLSSKSDIQQFQNLALLAHQVVEGFISGLHKSPFHGFSAEFAEHKSYNSGESTRFIDWKLFAKTEKLYTKRFEEETNLRCHLVLDASSSMHYPSMGKLSLDKLNKIEFSVLGCAALMHMAKKQRDAVGLSIYGAKIHQHTRDKSSERHHQQLLQYLSDALVPTPVADRTQTAQYLNQLAQQLPKRSLVVVFSDMLQNAPDSQAIFDALQHLKFKNHQVILMHVYDGVSEVSFDFDQRPRKFKDVETGQVVQVYPHQIKQAYNQSITEYFKAIELTCAQYKIQYVPADIIMGFAPVFTRFLVARQKFA